MSWPSCEENTIPWSGTKLRDVEDCTEEAEEPPKEVLLLEALSSLRSSENFSAVFSTNEVVELETDDEETATELYDNESESGSASDVRA